MIDNKAVLEKANATITRGDNEDSCLIAPKTPNKYL